MTINKAPDYISINGKLYQKKIFTYKYVTRPGLYGYKGIYKSVSGGKNLVEVVELSEWQIENALSEYLKCRYYQ
jgi:hypothetical protein